MTHNIYNKRHSILESRLTCVRITPARILPYTCALFEYTKIHFVHNMFVVQPVATFPQYLLFIKSMNIFQYILMIILDRCTQMEF